MLPACLEHCSLYPCGKWCAHFRNEYLKNENAFFSKDSKNKKAKGRGGPWAFWTFDIIPSKFVSKKKLRFLREKFPRKNRKYDHTLGKIARSEARIYG